MCFANCLHSSAPTSAKWGKRTSNQLGSWTEIKRLAKAVCGSAILASGRQRQEAHPKYDASRGHTVRPYLTKSGTRMRSSHKVSGCSSQSDLWLLLCKAAMSFFFFLNVCVYKHIHTWVHTCACVEARGCCCVSSLTIELDLAHLTG